MNLKNKTMYTEPKGFKGTPYEWRFIERNLDGDIENSRIPYGIEALPDFTNGVIPVMDSCAFPPNNRTNLERMKADAVLLSSSKELAKANEGLISLCERMAVMLKVKPEQFGEYVAAKEALAKAII